LDWTEVNEFFEKRGTVVFDGNKVYHSIYDLSNSAEVFTADCDLKTAIVRACAVSGCVLQTFSFLLPKLFVKLSDSYNGENIEFRDVDNFQVIHSDGIDDPNESIELWFDKNELLIKKINSSFEIDAQPALYVAEPSSQAVSPIIVKVASIATFELVRFDLPMEMHQFKMSD
jgi:hypothetical protein